MSAYLLELEVELVNTGSVFTDFQNLIDCSKAVLSEDCKTLHDIVRWSDNSTKKKLNIEKDKCLSAVCCITKYNVRTRWAMCTERRSWLHYLCEGIALNIYFADDAVYKCF